MPKFKKHVSSKQIARVLAVKTKVKEKFDEKTIRDEQLLSFSDKLTWAYTYYKKGKDIIISEIVTVAYVITIEAKNYTIVYFDNHHDKTLHGHLTKSMQDSSDTLLPILVKKGGNQKSQLNWALKHIRNNWYGYRKKFYKRSGLKPDF